MKKINGNCKAVRCLTNGKYYHSVKEAAADNGVHISAISYAIRKGGKCNGKEFGFESNMEKNIMKMDSNLSQTEISREEMAEFYRWKAEKDAAKKAQEEHAKAIIKAKEKLDKVFAECERRKAKLKQCEDALMQAQIELEDLLDMEV